MGKVCKSVKALESSSRMSHGFVAPIQAALYYMEFKLWRCREIKEIFFYPRDLGFKL
ncbi:hypothetical protein M5D96_011156 [Drosophila gunungcola]|uniref:Uncharacterized protein n=1 Tax=Drosophila gunungcola TaxID=103775 RepID=A0A9Q0BKQ2_9MUSC|nr:hypothetical protein M5D96_011156 [Drosophila gunungcola]